MQVLVKLLEMRLWIARRLRLGDDHTMLVWAALCGVLGAFATVLFREAIAVSQTALVGRSGSIVAMASALPWHWRLALPAVGGLLAGCVLIWAKRMPAPTASDYMEAVAVGDGRLPIRQTLLRSLSSLISIVSGGSIGREGSMVQLAALTASTISRAVALDPARLRVLVACGAAAGLTSAYNAPIAGAVFVTEIVIGSLAMNTFGPVLVASVVANIVMRELPGYHTPYEIPAFPPIFGPEILGFVGLGIVCGVMAPAFLAYLATTKRMFGRMRLPLPAKLAIGGLGVGAISLWMPQVWGNGYSVVNGLLQNPGTWTFVLLLLILKVIATGLTTGSGAVGGVFTPTLFVGAALGHLVGIGIQASAPGLATPAFAYVIVGMGAFLAATTQAPFMAILMLFEMTASYQVILPLMLACVVSYVIARSMGDASMYEVTIKRNKAVRSRTEVRDGCMRTMIRPAQTVLPLDADFSRITRLFSEFPVRYAYVVDPEGHYHGVVRVQDVADAISRQTDGAIPSSLNAEQLLKRDQIRAVTPETSLGNALEVFVEHKGERLPVVDQRDATLLGVVYKSSILEAYASLGNGE